MGTSNQSNCFCNFVFDCNLTQHVSAPTHVKGNLLDLVLISPSISVNHLIVHPLSVVNFSDHHAISFRVCCNVPSAAVSSTPGYTFDYCNANYDSISSYLLESDFSCVYDSCDIEFVWFCIKSLIYNAMLLYMPKILVKRHQGPKWFNSDIRHHLKCLRTLKRKFKNQPTQIRESKINHLQNLQSKLMQAKSEFETKLIEAHQISNSSALYSYIRSISYQNALPSTLYLDDLSAVSDTDKASLFNQFFYSVFTRSNFQLPPLHELTTHPSPISEASLLNWTCFVSSDLLMSLKPWDVMVLVPSY